MYSKKEAQKSLLVAPFYCVLGTVIDSSVVALGASGVAASGPVVSDEAASVLVTASVAELG